MPSLRAIAATKLCAGLVFAVAGQTAVHAQQLTAVRIASGLSRPVFVTAPAGDTERLFIVEQRGSAGVSTRGDVRILDLSNNTLLPTPFLSVTGLTTQSEQGFLGMAFDPDYASNGRFYIHYTASGGTTTVMRYQVSANPNVADPASGEVLLTVPQPFGNHNGGWIGFGPDGYLYVALGDGGFRDDPQNNGQNVNTLLGAILRLDVSGAGAYSIPPTNPFAAGGGRPEIWAYGLRNPWRNSFDRQTGDLWIADVGQDDWEEVNIQPAIGAPPYSAVNYGWRCYEGNAPFLTSGCAAPSTMKFPVHVYQIRNRPECAVTGGYVYRGCAMPELRGTYFFGDFCSAKIWSFRYSSGNVAEFQERTAELAPVGGPAITSISSFGEDANGELYIVSLGGNIFRVEPRCWANCDGSTTSPVLNVDDFTCFINRFSSGDCYANCDGSTTAPALNIDDFVCFINRYAAGCD